jgi:CDP-paratose 2-epimerase
VCKIIYLQIKKLKRINNTTFDVGGGKNNSISLKDLTTKCEKLTKNKIKIRRISKTSVFDIPYYVTNNSKIEKNYKWKPSKNVNQILKDIYTWLIDNKMLRNYF